VLVEVVPVEVVPEAFVVDEPVVDVLVGAVPRTDAQYALTLSPSALAAASRLRKAVGSLAESVPDPRPEASTATQRPCRDGPGTSGPTPWRVVVVVVGVVVDVVVLVPVVVVWDPVVGVVEEAVAAVRAFARSRAVVDACALAGAGMPTPPKARWAAIWRDVGSEPVAAATPLPRATATTAAAAAFALKTLPIILCLLRKLTRCGWADAANEASKAASTRCSPASSEASGGEHKAPSNCSTPSGDEPSRRAASASKGALRVGSVLGARSKESSSLVTPRPSTARWVALHGISARRPVRARFGADGEGAFSLRLGAGMARAAREPPSYGRSGGPIRLRPWVARARGCQGSP